MQTWITGRRTTSRTGGPDGTRQRNDGLKGMLPESFGTASSGRGQNRFRSSARQKRLASRTQSMIDIVKSDSTGSVRPHHHTTLPRCRVQVRQYSSSVSLDVTLWAFQISQSFDQKWRKMVPTARRRRQATKTLNDAADALEKLQEAFLLAFFEEVQRYLQAALDRMGRENAAGGGDWQGASPFPGETGPGNRRPLHRRHFP